MGEAAFWALVGASSLLIGVELAYALRPGRQVIGVVTAFGAGAMISAVAYELVAEAIETDELLRATAGIALGSLTFFVGDVLIDRMGGANRKRSSGKQDEGSPLAIVLGATLDAIPESVIVGFQSYWVEL